MAAPWPIRIEWHQSARMLRVLFDDGSSHDLSAELLRVESPSAEVQGHGGGDQKKIIGGKKNVAIRAVQPVGRYAIRLAFDDGHDSGIYSWNRLYHFGDQQPRIWQEYLDKLAALGLQREP